MEEFLQKQERREEKNKRKNRPIVLMTYVFVLVFLGLFGYVIYFLVKDADRVVANTGNRRQDVMAEVVQRGEIRTSDGTVIARSVEKDGEEVREYPYGEMFCHVVGYNGYGRSGLELSMNFQLLTTHENIFKQVQDDLSEKKKPGDNVITTLDYKLQKAASNAMGKHKGAVVVMEPDTGKILAMVSKPGFDPNEMEKVWDEIHTEEGEKSTVLLNRATSGLYAPGSTFKVVTALEYIREHKSVDGYSYTCKGEDSFNGVKIVCYKHREHGNVDLEHAIGYSCNTAFANMGMNDLSMEGLRKTAEDLLFNQELPYDGSTSTSSFVLSGFSSRDMIPQTVIGQGDTQITPIHNAMIMSAIANGGVLMKPYLVQEIRNSSGAVVKTYSSSSVKSLMTAKEAKQLSELLAAPAEYGTSSWKFKNYRHKIIGKTGTAEIDSEGHCNSWFVGYSNPEDPDIVVSVVIEDSDSDGLTGVEVAGAVFEAYYP
ncbi:MAG: penicillin-binding protein 2 [Eubacterium sp.]|nr:penicillin-binding protein 2 [Eubacterium sp.]